MRSIRRTVIGYVLMLLVTTLAFVMVIVHRTTTWAIEEREAVSRQLIEMRFVDQRDSVQLNRDRLLLQRTHTLAKEAQSQFDHTQFRYSWAATEVSLLASTLTPNGQVPMLVGLATTLPGPVAVELHTASATKLSLSEDEAERTLSDQRTEYVQINSRWGEPWRSPALVSSTLPTDTTMDAAPLYDHQYETITLPNGVAVRHVTLKVPVTQYRSVGPYWFMPRPRRPGPSEEQPPTPTSRAVTGLAHAARVRPTPPPGPRPVAPPTVPPFITRPTIYIHCAWEIADTEEQIELLAEQRDAQLVEAAAETQRANHTLNARLLWTTGAAIAMTMLGGWLLVGFSMMPLKRLSHAVSQISPKDFRVPIEPNSLPTEVSPVVDRLSQALSQLQEAFEREKRASADISHELRTPIAAMRTTLEVATKKPRTPEQYREILSDCLAIAKQMNQLVERMLQLAWVDAGMAGLHPEDVAINDLVKGCAAVGKPLAEQQGLQLKVQLVDDIKVHTDPDKLREVVMNLMHNAIEYTLPGGEVELTARRAMDGGVVVEVCDTGIGIPPEIQGKIFERFFRADPSRHATGSHAGLGLAIVKEYVERLQGRLTVESAVGRGSRFRIELPHAL